MRYPAGMDVDPATGDLIIADAYEKKIFRLPFGGSTLTVLSESADFIQPTHVPIQGTLAGGFIFVSDAIANGGAGQKILHRVDPSMPAAANSIRFSEDGFFEEIRGLEIYP